MQATVIDARVEFVDQPFLRPLMLSKGRIVELTEARVEVAVKIGMREATGRGSIYLSDLWAWPDSPYQHYQNDARLRTFCEMIASKLTHWCREKAHPLELGLRLHHEACSDSHRDVTSVLAKAMCASPFDAAIHDAAGLALGRSAFDLYGDSDRMPSADRFFRRRNACAVVAAMIEKRPRRLPAWVIVGKDDALAKDLAPWVWERNYSCFKLKIMGRDNEADVARTVEVFRAVKAYRVNKPRMTVDSNEANPDAASVLDYLERLRAADAEAFEALEYLEQPTARDILAQPQDWRAVTALKPVLLDEGLTHLELLPAALDQGWSGLALKTCKGHSFALTAAAWARENGLLLSLQDLTNPGHALIHAALFGLHVPTINGAELNSAQFTPAANTDWLPRMASLIEPRDGEHRFPVDGPIHGLGSRL